MIEDGVKLDNLIQVGHNVHIGAHRRWPAASGIAGSTVIGKRMHGGRRRHRLGHLTLADDVHISALGGDALDPPERSVQRRISHRRQCGLGEERGHAAPAPHLRERIRALEKNETTPETIMKTMDIHQILKKLPHRYPILLVDRVLELDKGRRIKAIKNVTINEPTSSTATSRSGR